MSDLVGNPEDRFSHNEAHLGQYVGQVLIFALNKEFVYCPNSFITSTHNLCFELKYKSSFYTSSCQTCGRRGDVITGPEAIKLFLFSTQLSKKLILLINNCWHFNIYYVGHPIKNGTFSMVQ